MGNNSTQNSKLDETVKESLNNYEAKYDAGDWSRMERMLDAAPKTSAANMSYGKIAIIAGAVVLGSFLVYKVANTSSSPKEETTAVPAPEAQQPEPAAVTNTAPPVTTNTVVSTPAETANTVSKPEPLPAATAVTETSKPATGAVKPIAEKTKKDKSKAEIEAEYNKHQKISVMGNEPVFGDMIDSSKGIIHETKEKESTKKAAKSKGTGAIGLGSLLQLNLDSLKKYNESKKDSIPK
jgi:hypothetical protein